MLQFSTILRFVYLQKGHFNAIKAIKNEVQFQLKKEYSIVFSLLFLLLFFAAFMTNTIVRPFNVLMGKKSNNKIIHRVTKSKLLTCLSGIIKYNCGTVLKNRLTEDTGSAQTAKILFQNTGHVGRC